MADSNGGILKSFLGGAAGKLGGLLVTALSDKKSKKKLKKIKVKDKELYDLKDFDKE